MSLFLVRVGPLIVEPLVIKYHLHRYHRQRVERRGERERVKRKCIPVASWIAGVTWVDQWVVERIEKKLVLTTVVAASMAFTREREKRKSWRGNKRDCRRGRGLTLHLTEAIVNWMRNSYYITSTMQLKQQSGNSNTLSSLLLFFSLSLSYSQFSNSLHLFLSLVRSRLASL